MKFPSSEPQDLLTQHLLDHLHALGFVGVGIGKTAASLSAVNKLFQRKQTVGTLVLAPMRVANLTWPLEVERWDDFKWMKVANLRSPAGKRAFLQGKAHIYVCNYESIPKLVELVKTRRSLGLGLPYDTLIVDECFASGTLVDTPAGKKPIEKVKKGDCVFNAQGVGFVTHVHINQPKRIAKVRIDGQDIWCSDTHLFFTSDGWVQAKDLQRGETCVASTSESVRMVQNGLHAEGPQQWHEDSFLQQAMFHLEHRSETERAVGGPSTKIDNSLRMVQDTFYPAQKQETLLRDILLSEMENAVEPQTCVDCRTSREVVERDEKVLRFRVREFVETARPHSKLKAYAERRVPGSPECYTEEDQAQTASARWERSPRFRPAKFSVPTFELDRTGVVEDGVHIQDERSLPQGSDTPPLQAGYWLREPEAVYRSGRIHSQVSEGQSEGPKEDRSFGSKRVESVEIYESTDIRLRRFRSRDGVIRFYDLSVSGHPSYSVNGCLVHNCTKLKNPTSKRANLYRREIPHDQHKRIWALTGTPAPNSLLDLFAQARFTDNGKRLGRAFEHFKQTYFKQTGYGGYKWKELHGSNEAIENRLADITLTLRSKDWLNLPETVVEDVEVHLPKNLIHDYKEFEKELVLQLKSAEITAPNAAALVAKLLQFTSGSIYDADSKWHDIHDLKIKALEKIIKQTEGPVLVACAFRHEQERLRKYFPKAKFFADAKNQTPQKQLLEDWNNKKIPILVAHPKSVGHGLNLQHGGNTLVWLTLTYSREDYEQMIARLDRRGQGSVVTVYRLMVPDTVDYAVATVIEEKKVTEDRLLTALQLLESYREGAVPRKKLTIKHEEDFC